MNRSIKIIFALSLFFISQASYASLDSLRIETIEGKKFIVHKVEPKETLYSLGKRYHVSVSAITQYNEDELDGYSIDQVGRILYIPFDPTKFSSKKPSAKKGIVHVVKAGETLYSISKKYEISQDQLMKINNLTSSSLSIGQELVVSADDTDSESEQPSTQASASGRKSTIHIVDMGETIYSISKKYDVSQQDLMEWNNLESPSISAGQRLKIQADSDIKTDKEVADDSLEKVKAAAGQTYDAIAQKYNKKEKNLKKWNNFAEPFVGGEMIYLVPRGNSSADKKEVKNSNSGKNAIVHTVESGETLYSLSTQYNVDVEDLRKWNNLDNYTISLGQKLFIADPDSFEDVKKNAESSDQEERNSDIEEDIKQEIVKEVKAPKDTKAIFTASEEDYEEIEKVTEKGIAELIEGSDKTEKYLALHRTAKIGTIVQVKNELNDKIIFVRVLGKLPDTGVDKKVVIKISKKAFEKLGGVDYKFPVQISYLPLKE